MIKPSDFQKFGNSVVVLAATMDNESYNKGYKDSEITTKQNIANIIDLKSLKKALENGWVKDENFEALINLLVENLEN
jgi:hypothetical protein